MVVTHEDEVPSGWPLGLENMNIRLRVAERSQAAAASRLYVSSPSFSSFSSSSLDTESTMSFFQDQSVSLGRLIGIKPGSRGRLEFSNRVHNENVCVRRSEAEDYKGQQGDNMSHKLCVPLLHNVLEKMSRSKSNSHAPKN
ncbi:hypothetical protein KY290_014524 [Solanum tuberosum]|uniref:Uncharacterized protein n=1 Tax=Solanum tuberosum TaxID=4113 RepID=A0ABQ7VQ27_SOLTU|nr:hypothetical protein KY284_013925 [Solanum tuberosum]KAH0770543.1 hypothetical protein KY290_014524 [Solanum tuberosum]